MRYITGVDLKIRSFLLIVYAMFNSRLKLVSVVGAACLLAAPHFAWSLDDDRLWLPAKYRAHYFDLKEAALVAESLDNCTEVLRATLDLDLSTPDHAFYRVLCRRADGVSYSEVIDGSTMVAQSSIANEAPPETAGEREQRLALEAQKRKEEEALVQQRQEEAAKAAVAARNEAEQAASAEAERQARRARELERRATVFAEVCTAEIVARTSMMENLSWITEKPIAEELDNGQMRFHAEFDAQNMWGEELHYKAVCTISTPAELVVVVSKR